MRKIAFLLYFSLVFQAAWPQSGTSYVVLVSFDGFRYDYVEKYDLENFNQLIIEGTAAEKMIPSFPSKTFPNHYSIVTGLYPGNHGLVDNTFYDSISNETYKISNRDMVRNSFYYGGMPLWQLVQENGMKSASYFWVGSETAVAGSYPDHFKYYDESVGDQERINAVMNWLRLPEEDRPHFISLYFSFIDHVTHAHGPDAPESEKALRYADQLLGELKKQIESLDLPVTLIIVSDHGMYPMILDKEYYIDLSGIKDIAENQAKIVNNGSHMHIYCDGEVKQRILKQLENKEDHFRTYLRENTPDRWHYNGNYRIGDILLVAEPGFSFSFNPNDNKHYGAHGYDPYTTPEMGAIFYAWGPRIKKNKKIPAFENIHVYPLIAHILGIETPAIDGSVRVLQDIVVE